jgi:acetamidase/formamidase
MAAVCATGQQPDLSGDWVVSSNVLGTTTYLSMELKQTGDGFAGQYAGDKITSGSLHDGVLHLIATTQDESTSYVVSATLSRTTLAGTTIQTDPVHKNPPLKYSFTAMRAVRIEHNAPRQHEFTPTAFYLQYSPANKPALTIAPGDTVHTTTLDAFGIDANGVQRAPDGNAETGPFYIQGAWPGDTLVVHILKLRLNRDYAVSDDSLVERAMNSDLAVMMKDSGKTIRWHLDNVKGVAYPEGAGPNLRNFTMPLKPMLGCIATAISPAEIPPPALDSGGYGGNMDFNEIGEGATIYLPVANPGALLYMGDAHARQGDGELNYNALETSMDVEFSVDVIPGTHLQGPRIETPTHIVTMGLSASLEDALKDATDAMAKWLNEDYSLTPSETAQVLGMATEYEVSEVADRNSAVVLKIDKQRLVGLVKKDKP